MFSKLSMIMLFMSALVNVNAVADEGLPLHGFADAGGGFVTSGTPADQKIRGFKIGTIDFYLSPEFEDGVKSLMEIAFEPSHDDGSIMVDVERLQVGYTFSDLLTLWVGRFHTPYGVYNTAFHHGSQLQTAIYRPKFLDFEDNGGILSAHSVGLWGKGQFKMDRSKLAYNLYVANGSRIILEDGGPGALDMNNYRNDKSSYMVGGTLSYHFLADALEGLEVGVHGFQSKVSAYPGADYKVDATHVTKVNMAGGFFHYDQNNIDLLGEYYGFSDKDQLTTGAKKIKSNAQFVQLGYKITESITPFTRFEKTALNQNDLYFTDQLSGRSYTRYAAGLRKDINPKAAFKLEFTRTTRDGNNPKYNIFQYNYAVRF